VLQWAIVNGEQETGVTLHYVDENIDTGPVIAETRIPIDPDDDAASLSGALIGSGLRLLREHWVAIARGEAAAVPQPSGGRYWPLRTETDGEIDWNESAVRIRDLVRALVAPWPGATFDAGGRRVTVDVAQVDDLSGEPGVVLAVAADRLVVAARLGAVAICAARIGKLPVKLDGLGLVVGDRLSA
jgi:methionyl-tRNA formyltransferase